MHRSAYPFPLAVNSGHHSQYHRFLLGTDPAVIDPFPKPYCVGALAGFFADLAEGLNLQKWRKLYHGALPWAEGHGREHYALGNVAPHRPLPRSYCRPWRRFGAYDLVQVADPSVSALALVAGDRRVLTRFFALCDDACARIEPAAATRAPGPARSRATSRMLAGQFFEPNNRWLMPFLHAHSRVLNLTSHAEAPARLSCIDSAALAAAAEREGARWVADQAGALSDLGYGVSVEGTAGPRLKVAGVPERLLAAIEAPRIAVLRMLERIICGDRASSSGRLASELPPEVTAAMADRLERALAGPGWHGRPTKIDVPAEGPWRHAVREHLARTSPSALAVLDEAAARAKADIYAADLFPTPPLDPAHSHVPQAESIEALEQAPTDPELGMGAERTSAEPARASWLEDEFKAAVGDVHERLARRGPSDPVIRLRDLLARIDALAVGADARQLAHADMFLGEEMARRTGNLRDALPQSRLDRAPLLSVDDLFESARLVRAACEPEIGGRSL
jgi:hypothetical protein